MLKDELGAGVYPSGKFGANAAWLRLQVLTLNLLACLKAVGLEAQDRRARPKRLRFAIFPQFGRVVRQARQIWLRLGTDILAGLLWPARGRVAQAAWGRHERGCAAALLLVAMPRRGMATRSSAASG